MTGRQLALAHQRLHRLRQLQQPQHVGDVRAALADDLRDVILAVVEFFHQREIASRFLDGVEVGALHVFDDGEFERLRVGRLDNRDRHFVEPCALRRAPAAFAGDDLELVVAAGDGAHDDRLNDTAFLDRRGELSQFGFGKVAARVARIGDQIFNRRLARFA